MPQFNNEKNIRIKRYLSNKSVLKLTMLSILLSIICTYIIEIITTDQKSIAVITLIIIFLSNSYLLLLLSPKYSWVEVFFWALFITVLFLPLMTLLITGLIMTLITGI